MKNVTGYFEGRDIRKLFYQYWLPDGDIKAYIIIIHGWGTHSDRMKYPAEYLTDKGYAIYTFDLRGHWRSSGDIPGHIDNMDHLQKDLVLFMDVVIKDAGNKKIFLAGHAFGGLLSIIYAIHHPNFPGILISSPQLGLTMKVARGKKFDKKFSGSFSKLSPTKSVEISIDQNLLTSDIKILREHIADKNKLEIMTVKSGYEINEAMKWTMKNALKLACPVFFMQAGNDKITDKKKLPIFLIRLKIRIKNIKNMMDSSMKYGTNVEGNRFMKICMCG